MSEEKKPKLVKTRRVNFPRNSLLECINVIKELKKAAGNKKTVDRYILAKSLDSTLDSSVFKTILASCGRYKLTEKPNADEIGISDLGNKILEAKDKKTKDSAILEALFNVTIFKEVIMNYNKNEIPKVDVFLDVLKSQFRVKEQDCKRLYEIIMKNIEELGILDVVKGKKNVYIGNLDVDLDSDLKIKQDDKTVEKVEDFVEDDESAYEDYMEDIIEPTPTDMPVSEESESLTPRIFISHSKNFKILDQIKSIVEAFKDVQVHKKSKISSLVAIDEAKTSKPVPTEIFEMMRKCNCAIINVSLDKENIHTTVIQDKDGNKREDTIYKINPNVLIEIGSAYYGYDERVILIVDKRLKDEIPSNLQGLYYHYYEGEELGHDATMKLFKAIAKFFEKED